MSSPFVPKIFFNISQFFNFYLAFFTPLITDRIDFAYGYIFAGCNLAAACLIYFFLIESNGKSLEEIDTMYLLRVPSRHSSDWEAPVGMGLGNADVAGEKKAKGRNIDGRVMHRERA